MASDENMIPFGMNELEDDEEFYTLCTQVFATWFDEVRPKETRYRILRALIDLIGWVDPADDDDRHVFVWQIFEIPDAKFLARPMFGEAELRELKEIVHGVTHIRKPERGQRYDKDLMTYLRSGCGLPI